MLSAQYSYLSTCVGICCSLLLVIMGCFSPELSLLRNKKKKYPAAVLIHGSPLSESFSLQRTPSGLGMMPAGIQTECYLPKSVGKVVRWWNSSSGPKNKSPFLMRAGWEFSSETCFIGKCGIWYVLTRWNVWSKPEARDPPQNWQAGNAAMWKNIAHIRALHS